MDYIVNIAIPVPLNKLFSYRVESDRNIEELIGCRVLVQFGRRSLTGIIIEENVNPAQGINIKSVLELIDDIPSFSSAQIRLAKWISNYYLCSLGIVLTAALPAGMSPKTLLTVTMLRVLTSKEIEAISGKSVKRIALLNYLSKHKGNVSVAYLQKKLRMSNLSEHLDALAQSGILDIETGLTKRVTSKIQTGIKLNERFITNQDELRSILDEYDKSKPKYSALISYLYLSQTKGIIPKLSSIKKTLDISQSIPKTLEKIGIVEFVDIEIDRSVISSVSLSNIDESKHKLTLEQKNSLSFIKKLIRNNDSRPHLIHGVTGSGKTLVYIQAIKHVIAKGASALFLVPEISLTPQLIDRFKMVFGDKITALHSRMSDGERFDAWRLIRSGEKRIVIGARSAVFAPLQNLGIIIVDEEHDASYKQDSPVPRYNGRDIAVMRAKIEVVPCILGSATPSLESRYNAETGKYTLSEINNRADNAVLPEIIIVDRVAAMKSGQMNGSFSKQLLEEITDKLEKKEGIILFQNRRGYAPLLECTDCGFIPMCQNCDITLTLHKNQRQLRCHYCGYTIAAFNSCPACGFPELNEQGSGTQRIEEELLTVLADEGFNPVIQRVDLDTTTRKGALRKIFTSFIAGETDILIGTQMVAKGLDFSRVTLVGVINADMQMFLPDFRSNERTFQMMTQVAGRSGRTGEKPGKVIVQTSHPNHPSLKSVLNSSYKQFYDFEISNREKLRYPPFVRFINIEISGKNEQRVDNAAFRFYKLLPDNPAYLKFGPSLPFIPKLMNNYRRQIIIKSDKEKDVSGSIVRNALIWTMNRYDEQYSSASVRIKIDMDAYSTL